MHHTQCLKIVKPFTSSGTMLVVKHKYVYIHCLVPILQALFNSGLYACVKKVQ